MAERNHNELSFRVRFYLGFRRLFLPFADWEEGSLIPWAIAVFGGAGLGTTCAWLLDNFVLVEVLSSPAVYWCVTIPNILAMVFVGIFIAQLIRLGCQDCARYPQAVLDGGHFWANFWLRNHQDRNKTTDEEPPVRVTDIANTDVANLE